MNSAVDLSANNHVHLDKQCVFCEHRKYEQSVSIYWWRCKISNESRTLTASEHRCFHPPRQRERRFAVEHKEVQQLQRRSFGHRPRYIYSATGFASNYQHHTLLSFTKSKLNKQIFRKKPQMCPMRRTTHSQPRKNGDPIRRRIS